MIYRGGFETRAALVWILAIFSNKDFVPYFCMSAMQKSPGGVRPPSVCKEGWSGLDPLPPGEGGGSDSSLCKTKYSLNVLSMVVCMLKGSVI